jgi:hypothetical protein
MESVHFDIVLLQQSAEVKIEQVGQIVTDGQLNTQRAKELRFN